MKNKQIFIVSAIALVVAFGGALMSLYLRHPEILTKTPAEIILGDIDKQQREQIKHIDSSPTNFIVEDKYWANASILRTADGGHRVGVGFSSISVGAKIYAPMDGYLRVFDGKQRDGSPIEFFILTQDKEWEPWGRPDQRSWIIQARGLTPLVAGKVSKGQAFATIRESEVIFRGFYMGEVVFITSPDAWWARMPNDAITDPREYLIEAMHKIN